MLAVHVFVFFALLTQRAPKATFVSLAILVVMPVFALDVQGWIVGERFIVRRLVAVGAVIIAFFTGVVFAARNDLTNRSSQPLAVVMSAFDFMKQFSMFATLAASGGSAPSR